MPIIRKATEAKRAQKGDAASAPRVHSGETATARWRAVRALPATPDSAARLAEMLARETDWSVREAIFTALARIGTLFCAQTALLYIRHSDARLRAAALDALRAMPQAAGALLPALLANPDRDIRLLACALTLEAQGEATTLLTSLLARESDANVCAAAIESLAEIGGAGAADAVRRCAERFPDHSFIAFAVATALEQLSGKSGAA